MRCHEVSSLGPARAMSPGLSLVIVVFVHLLNTSPALCAVMRLQRRGHPGDEVLGFAQQPGPSAGS